MLQHAADSYDCTYSHNSTDLDARAHLDSHRSTNMDSRAHLDSGTDLYPSPSVDLDSCPRASCNERADANRDGFAYEHSDPSAYSDSDLHDDTHSHSHQHAYINRISFTASHGTTYANARTN